MKPPIAMPTAPSASGKLAARDLPGRARPQLGPRPATRAVRGHCSRLLFLRDDGTGTPVLGGHCKGKENQLQFILAAQHTVRISSHTRGDFCTQNGTRVRVLWPQQ